MVWTCDETRGTNAISVVLKMNVKGIWGRGRTKKMVGYN
jgi:hypothetical protein